MGKLLYQGKQIIMGEIAHDNGQVVEINLDAGGSMMLLKDDIAIVPEKEAKKTAKKEHKKADNTDVAESGE